MKIGRILLGGASALTATGLALVPNVASAHSASWSPSCDGFSVSVDSFTPGVVTTITIDGTSVTREGDFQDTWEWDRTRDHTWAVVVDAVEPHYDDRDSGTQKACVSDTSSTQPPQTTATAETTTTAPAPAETTTTAPGETTTTTTGPGGTTTTAPGVTATTGATTTTAPGSVGGVAGTTPRSPSSPRATSPARAAGSLPATGYGTGPLAAAGAVALVMGGAMLLAGRRRSTS